MNKTEILKDLISKTGLNMKTFAIEAGIPYTTLRSMLERGIDKASVNNVIKVCSKLNISVEELYNISQSVTLTNEEQKLLNDFNSLNSFCKTEALKIIAELKVISNYSKELTNPNNLADKTSKNSPKVHICESNCNDFNIEDSNIEHIGMAAHNDYANDPEELLLMQKDLDEL